jgi:single-strand DNA-binding protein
MNLVILRGHLSRPPERRTLPSGDDLVAYEVTVSRDDGPAESVPVVWFGAPASAVDHDAGEAVVVAGRVRRRFFRAGGVTQSRTEVVAGGVIPARHTKRAARLLHGAVEAVQEASDRYGAAAPDVR